MIKYIRNGWYKGSDHRGICIGEVPDRRVLNLVPAVVLSPTEQVDLCVVLYNTGGTLNCFKVDKYGIQGFDIGLELYA